MDRFLMLRLWQFDPIQPFKRSNNENTLLLPPTPVKTRKTENKYIEIHDNTAQHNLNTPSTIHLYIHIHNKTKAAKVKENNYQLNRIIDISIYIIRT